MSTGMSMNGLGIEGHWIAVKDGDPRAVTLYKRHYSASKAPADRLIRHGITPPGETMVPITLNNDSLFVWHRAMIERQDHQEGVACSVFRNEGPILSSLLVQEAMELAWARWPGQRLFTYVWDAKVRSVNPGYCFKMAGWQTCGRNKDGRLTILEVYPNGD